MNIGNTAHSYKWQIVQKPSNHRIKASVMDLVDFSLLEVVEASLPTDQVPEDNEAEDAEGSSGAPVDGWVTKEEVLDNLVVPTAHAETNVENGPLPEVGG